MAKEATLQVRMDAQLKEEVEELYKNMGTSFAEAVRIFAKQSVVDQKMPFTLCNSRGNAFGILSQYANPDLIEQENAAYERETVKKYEKLD